LKKYEIKGIIGGFKKRGKMLLKREVWKDEKLSAFSILRVSMSVANLMA
jgi:hypothetical protein